MVEHAGGCGIVLATSFREPSIELFLSQYCPKVGYDVLVCACLDEWSDGFDTGQVRLALVDASCCSDWGREYLNAAREEARGAPVMYVESRRHRNLSSLTLRRAGATDVIRQPCHLGAVADQAPALLELGRQPRVSWWLGDLELDLQSLEVRYGGESLRLTATDLRLMVFFFRHAGTRGLDADTYAQMTGAAGAAGRLRHLASELSKKLAGIGLPNAIPLVPGYGYVLDAPGRCAPPLRSSVNPSLGVAGSPWAKRSTG